jgi:hypothetical protein
MGGLQFLVEHRRERRVHPQQAAQGRSRSMAFS